MPWLDHSPGRVGGAAIVALLLTGCLIQGSEATEFPEGLEPIGESTAEAPGAPGEYPEDRNVVTGEEGDYIYVHMRGYIREPIADVWRALQEPDVVADRRQTDSQTVTELPDSPYDLAFRIHFVENDILTVEWDTEYRYGAVEGTFAEPELTMMRWQKVLGTDFIYLMEAAVMLKSVDEGITEITLVEHLDALQEDEAVLENYANDLFDELVAFTDGEPLPTY